MDCTFLDVDMLTLKGRYLGDRLRVMFGRDNKLRGENPYVFSPNTEFLLRQQNAAFGAADAMRELAKEDNYKSYGDYTKKQIKKATEFMTIRALLKK